MVQFTVEQQKPLNVIYLGQTKSDNTNRTITITDGICLVMLSKWVFLNVITLTIMLLMLKIMSSDYI